jgi:hypothetical protein
MSELDNEDTMTTDYNYLNFPDENSSLYMTLPNSGFGIVDFFDHPFV